MAIIWTKLIPRWGGLTIEPPEAKKDTGYIAGDKPPAKWENWLRKGTYEALDETRDVIEGIDSQLAQNVSNLNAHKAEKASSTDLGHIKTDSIDENGILIFPEQIWQEIESVTLLQDTAEVVFTNIDIKYRFLKLMVKGNSSNTSPGTLQLWVNGNTSHVFSQLTNAFNPSTATSPSYYEILINNALLGNDIHTLYITGGHMSTGTSVYTVNNSIIKDSFPTASGRSGKIESLSLTQSAFNIGANTQFILFGMI